MNFRAPRPTQTIRGGRKGKEVDLNDRHRVPVGREDIMIHDMWAKLRANLAVSFPSIAV